ncbi:hypothetical protein GPALN_013360 [Globodera pallida]|nr:hypothetical protein GPALN_013360 [Globodera pallida]
MRGDDPQAPGERERRVHLGVGARALSEQRAVARERALAERKRRRVEWVKQQPLARAAAAKAVAGRKTLRHNLNISQHRAKHPAGKDGLNRLESKLRMLPGFPTPLMINFEALRSNEYVLRDMIP